VHTLENIFNKPSGRFEGLGVSNNIWPTIRDVTSPPDKMTRE
jgi:hypothetical protein